MKTESRFIEKTTYNGTVFLIHELYIGERFICLKAVREGGAYSIYGINKDTLLRNIARYYLVEERQHTR